MYARINLATSAIGPVGPLPPALLGLSETSLADLEAALAPCPAEYAGTGYWPVVPAEPPALIPGETAEPAGDEALVLDAAGRVVRRPWVVVPAPVTWRLLTANELIDLLVGVAGQAAFLAAWSDPALELWRIKVSVARDIDRDAPGTRIGLDALVAAGHLTEAQRQQVLDAWPVG